MGSGSESPGLKSWFHYQPFDPVQATEFLQAFLSSKIDLMIPGVYLRVYPQGRYHEDKETST